MWIIMPPTKSRNNEQVTFNIITQPVLCDITTNIWPNALLI